MTGKKKKEKEKGWLGKNLESEKFRRLYARENFIEKFLDVIDDEMRKLSVSRAELARRMGRSPSNITQIMNRTRNLSAATMVDLAFFLGIELSLGFDLTYSFQDFDKYRSG